MFLYCGADYADPHLVLCGTLQYYHRGDGDDNVFDVCMLIIFYGLLVAYAQMPIFQYEGETLCHVYVAMIAFGALVLWLVVCTTIQLNDKNTFDYTRLLAATVPIT